MSTRSTLLLEHHLKELNCPPSSGSSWPPSAPPKAADYLAAELSTATSAWCSAVAPASPPPRVDTFDFLAIPSEQATGHATGPLRIHRAQRERNRHRQQRHRQDPHRPGLGPSCLPKGNVGGFHRRRRTGPRTHGGQGRVNLQRQLARLNLLIRRVGLRAGPPPARNCSSRSSANATNEAPSGHRQPFDEWTEVFGSERLTGVTAGPPHPPRAHPGDERRQLPPQGQPAEFQPPISALTPASAPEAGPPAPPARPSWSPRWYSFTPP